jgi:hypothetical protein
MRGTTKYAKGAKVGMQIVFKEERYSSTLGVRCSMLDVHLLRRGNYGNKI